MKRYTAGLLFSNTRDKVVLVEKLKPAWQRGKLNAVGGKIEEGEEPLEAQIREFKEEAGVEIKDWELLVEYSNPKVYTVYFYKAFSDLIYHVQQQEEEPIRIIPVKKLPTNLIYNIRWLIPLALDHYVRGYTRIEGA